MIRSKDGDPHFERTHSAVLRRQRAINRLQSITLNVQIDLTPIFCSHPHLPYATLSLLLGQADANRRGGFLLKLSTASATASDAVKLSLIVLQAELLRFCAVYSPAHADVAAGWCDALAITALSLDSGALWNTASRVVAETTILLLAEFRGQASRYSKSN